MKSVSCQLPAISIIVPVYNADRYIDQCVCSLVKQSFEDIEIILVNDCSADHSLIIIREWERKDPRIRVIDLPCNAGVAVARNKGIEAARGKWIAFVDNDDWVDPDRYQKMHDCAIQNDADAVLDGYVGDDGDGRAKYRKQVTSHLRMFTGIQMIHEMFFGKISLFEPWHGIYNRKIVQDGVRFQSVRAEDAMFNFEFFARASRVLLIPGCTYHFRLIDVSLSRGYVSPQSVYSLYGVDACAAYLKNNKNLRSLVPDFDLIADFHLLNQYAIVARQVLLMPRTETFSQRCCFLSQIADSCNFRASFENVAARSLISSRKRAFLALLYARQVNLATSYMSFKSKWKKIENFIKWGKVESFFNSCLRP